MELSSFAILVSAGVGFLGVAMGLYAVAVHLGRIISIHDLTVEAHTLRIEYAQRLAALRGEFEEESNFEYVDESSKAPQEAVELENSGEEEELKQAA